MTEAATSPVTVERDPTPVAPAPPIEEAPRGDVPASATVASPAPAAEVPAPEISSAPPAEHVSQAGFSVLGLSRDDSVFALFAGGLILLLMLAQWARLAVRGGAPVEIERLASTTYQFQIDINRATWVEWMQLDEIGETMARRIVADREERGDFRSIDDLRRVRGIGPKTLAAIRPWLHCSERELDTPTEQAP